MLPLEHRSSTKSLQDLYRPGHGWLNLVAKVVNYKWDSICVPNNTYYICKKKYDNILREILEEDVISMDSKGDYPIEHGQNGRLADYK